MTTIKRLNQAALCLLLCLFMGCATLNLQPPQVSVISIKPAATSGFSTAFDIKLNIVNPNAVALPIEGMSYQLTLNGIQVLRGAAGNISTIPAYGNTEVTLPVTANLLAAPKLLVLLANQSAPTLDYELSATIDLQGFLPSQHIVEKGQLN